jgi:hypothetical protein
MTVSRSILILGDRFASGVCYPGVELPRREKFSVADIGRPLDVAAAGAVIRAGVLGRWFRRLER